MDRIKIISAIIMLSFWIVIDVSAQDENAEDEGYAKAVEADQKYTKALGQIHNNKYRKAAANLTEAIEIEPTDAEYIGMRGEAYRNLDMKKDAKANFHVALALDSSVSVAYFGLAKYYLTVDPTNDKIEWGLSKALEYATSRDSKQEILELATNYYLEYAKFDLAEAYSEKLYELNSENIDFKKLRAEALYESGKKEEAVAVLEEILEKDGENIECIISLGYLYNQVGEHPKAEKLIDETLVKEKENPYLLANKSMALVEQGKLEQAKDAIELSLYNDEDNPYAYYVSGIIFVIEDDYRNACVDFKRADRKTIKRNNTLGQEIADAVFKYCN